MALTVNWPLPFPVDTAGARAKHSKSPEIACPWRSAWKAIVVMTGTNPPASPVPPWMIVFPPPRARTVAACGGWALMEVTVVDTAIMARSKARLTRIMYLDRGCITSPSEILWFFATYFQTRVLRVDPSYKPLIRARYGSLLLNME